MLTPCVVCKNEFFEILCSASDVEAHLRYLHSFHRRRLRLNAEGLKAEEALIDRAHFTQNYITNIVICTACGCVCRNPHPAAHAVLNAYSSDRYGEHRLEGLFETQIEFYRRKAHQLRRWLVGRSNVKILEVGSFVGSFLAVGREYGWEMCGVDPGKEVNTFCRQKGFQVFEGTLAEVPLQDDALDCIAIWNTFDQLADPRPTVSAAFRLLRPGGILAIRTPNGQCFRYAISWMRRWPSFLGVWLRAALAWNNMLAFPYMYGYSLRPLDFLLAQHGFARIGEQADVLPQLADDHTKDWAAQEERWLKQLWLLTVKCLPFRSTKRLAFAPWIDVYYRRA